MTGPGWSQVELLRAAQQDQGRRGKVQSRTQLDEYQRARPTSVLHGLPRLRPGLDAHTNAVDFAGPITRYLRRSSSTVTMPGLEEDEPVDEMEADDPNTVADQPNTVTDEPNAVADVTMNPATSDADPLHGECRTSDRLVNKRKREAQQPLLPSAQVSGTRRRRRVSQRPPGTRGGSNRTGNKKARTERTKEQRIRDADDKAGAWIAQATSIKDLARGLVSWLRESTKGEAVNYTIAATKNVAYIAKVNGVTQDAKEMRDLVSRLTRWGCAYSIVICNNFSKSSAHAEMCVLAAIGVDSLSSIKYLECTCPSCHYCAITLKAYRVPNSSPRGDPKSQQGWRHPFWPLAFGTQLGSHGEQVNRLNTLLTRSDYPPRAMPEDIAPGVRCEPPGGGTRPLWTPR